MRFFACLGSKCWASDRLAQRGLPRQEVFALYVIILTTLKKVIIVTRRVNHVLLKCDIVRMVWHMTLNALGGSDWVPRNDDNLIGLGTFVVN